MKNISVKHAQKKEKKVIKSKEKVKKPRLIFDDEKNHVNEQHQIKLYNQFLLDKEVEELKKNWWIKLGKLLRFI